MTPTYSFDIDPNRDLARITMGGFFSPDDVARFRQARDTAYQQLTCGPHEHVTLVDMRGMHIQSQEAVAEFTKLFADPAYASKALAIVVSRSLARLQVQRAAAGRTVAYFTEDMEAAERCLLEAR